jgi:hypothetical protein
VDVRELGVAVVRLDEDGADHGVKRAAGAGRTILPRRLT